MRSSSPQADAKTPATPSTDVPAIARILLDAQNITGIPLRDMQLNFCIHGVQPTQIKERLTQYLDAKPAELKPVEVNALREATFHPNATLLHDYPTTLEWRGESFMNAAKLITKHTAALDAHEKKTIIDNLEAMYKKYKNNLASVATIEVTKKREKRDSIAQTHYNAFIKGILITLNKKIFQEHSLKEIRNLLINAETLQNIQKHKAIVTVSGNREKGLAYLQVEQPKNTFADLSELQKARWKAVSLDQEMKQNQWFENFPDWEKNFWKEKIRQAQTEPTKIAVAPVVKKSGMLGLRNILASSFARIQYQPRANQLVNPKIFVSPPTLRSSNLVVTAKEAQESFSKEEKELTQENISQAYDICPTPVANSTAYPWPLASQHGEYRPLILFQTLLRTKFGGDDYVIKHKNDTINALKKHPKLASIFLYSNHSIGAGEFRRSEEMMYEPNTPGFDHVEKPVKKFINEVLPAVIKSRQDVLREQVQTTSQINNDDTKQRIISALHRKSDEITRFQEECNSIFNKASKGELSELDLQRFKENAKLLNDEFHPELDRNTSLARIFSALNAYVVATKERDFPKNYQLHLAALEEIIYQSTGNKFHSSCKSGKDREGALKCYRNALLAYHEQYHHFPPLSTPKENRKIFVEIFVDLFRTHHQARVAELNALGCEGQKSLKNFLPDDIYKALKNYLNNDVQLIKAHAYNASLNEFGHEKIKADSQTQVNYAALSAQEDATLSQLIKEQEEGRFDEDEVTVKMASSTDLKGLEIIRATTPPHSRSPSPALPLVDSDSSSTDHPAPRHSRNRSATIFFNPSSPSMSSKGLAGHLRVPSGATTVTPPSSEKATDEKTHRPTQSDATILATLLKAQRPTDAKTQMNSDLDPEPLSDDEENMPLTRPRESAGGAPDNKTTPSTSAAINPAAQSTVAEEEPFENIPMRSRR